MVAAVSALPAISEGGTADIVGSLSGPSSGNVGDTLTYTVTASNRGPDAGQVEVSFAMSKSQGLELVSAGCPQSETDDQILVQCPPATIAVGETVQLVVQTRVKQISATTLDGFANPAGGADPNTSNNAVSIVVLQPAATPPPPPPPAAMPTYMFAGELPHAMQRVPYWTVTVPCNPLVACPRWVALAAGSLPPGINLGDDVNGSLIGKPTTPGSYTFTVDAVPYPGSNVAMISHQYTLVVDQYQNTTTTSAGSTASTKPPVALVGKTVLLAKRSKSRSCRRGDLPDRRCSPGAYYAKLTKKVLCSASFRTGTIRNVPQSEKTAVEREYGMAAKSYGRTPEIDYIISLGLGGSNDIANLFAEPGSGRATYHTKDKLENKLHALVCGGKMSLATARRGIATNWETLYQSVFGVKP